MLIAAFVNGQINSDGDKGNRRDYGRNKAQNNATTFWLHCECAVSGPQRGAKADHAPPVSSAGIPATSESGARIAVCHPPC
jgi:hypothetical protein